MFGIGCLKIEMRWHTTPRVVPANAGTHNHRCLLERKPSATGANETPRRMGARVSGDDIKKAPRQLDGNEFCLPSANHKPAYPGLRISEWRVMLRFRILASSIPLLVAAAFARGGLLPGPHPCIAISDTSVEIASMPWRADLHVAFTDDPAA